MVKSMPLIDGVHDVIHNASLVVGDEVDIRRRSPLTTSVEAWLNTFIRFRARNEWCIFGLLEKATLRHGPWNGDITIA